MVQYNGDVTGNIIVGVIAEDDWFRKPGLGALVSIFLKWERKDVMVGIVGGIVLLGLINIYNVAAIAATFIYFT